MGAGTYRAGIGLAGANPLATVGVQSTTGPQRAAKYDPFTKTFPLDANGNFIDVHPVDQGVAMALGISVGKLRSAPTTGHGLLALPRASPSKSKSDVTAAVNEALAPWVARGDIAIVSIDSDTPNPNINGTTIVAVSYHNLRLPIGQPAVIHA